jgi:hypothetical protein
VLQKFVGESGLVYYKCAFEKLIDAYGIRNSKLSDVDDRTVRGNPGLIGAIDVLTGSELLPTMQDFSRMRF